MCNHFQSQRDKVIEAALTHVPFDGWSWKAMEAGAKDVANDAVPVSYTHLTLPTILLV